MKAEPFGPAFFNVAERCLGVGPVGCFLVSMHDKRCKTNSETTYGSRFTSDCRMNGILEYFLSVLERLPDNVAEYAVGTEG